MKKYLAILFCVILINPVKAQNPLVKQWDKRFGGTDDDEFCSFQQTTDGGYILGGISLSGISGDKTQSVWGTAGAYWDYWIVKTDSMGNKQWDKDFGGTDQDYLYCIQQTSDGGFILGGTSYSGISGDKTQSTWSGSVDYWVVKIDSAGNKQWDKDYGGTGHDELLSIQQTYDGGYILGGYSGSGMSGDKTQNAWGGTDYWIVKTDSLGNKQWDKDFGGTGDEYFYSIQQTADGGYILGGYSDSPISGDKTQNSWQWFDYWIVKIDSIGNKQWDKDFGGTDQDYLWSIQQTSDGGYIMGGRSYSGISGDKTQTLWGVNNDIDYWIVKTDSLGNKQWDKDFGGTSREECYRVIQTTDDGYLISGDSYSNISGDKTENNLGQEQSWIVKTDSLGNKQWDKTLRTNTLGHDEIGLAIQTKEGCYAIANSTSAGVGADKTQPAWGSNDYWIIKFCDSTLTTSINQISDSKFSVSIYPNPSNTLLNFFLTSTENIIITNTWGEIVLQKKVKGKVELDISFLSAGIYFIKVGNEMRKFVKE